MQKIVIGLLILVVVVIVYYTYFVMPSGKKTLLGLSLDGSNPFGLNFIGGSRGSVGVEDFMNPASLDYKMGEYSNIKLTKDEKIKYDKLYHMHNEIDEFIEIPQPCDSFECKYDIVPSVDGTDSAPKSAAMFKFNKSAPECCPSPYSTSSGCVCLTDKQKDYISANRGDNA